MWHKKNLLCLIFFKRRTLAMTRYYQKGRCDWGRRDTNKRSDAELRRADVLCCDWRRDLDRTSRRLRAFLGRSFPGAFLKAPKKHTYGFFLLTCTQKVQKHLSWAVPKRSYGSDNGVSEAAFVSVAEPGAVGSDRSRRVRARRVNYTTLLFVYLQLWSCLLVYRRQRTWATLGSEQDFKGKLF